VGIWVALVANGSFREPQKAVGAVARHLAGTTYWILSEEESYREPRWKLGASTRA
jgi:hypothetical protein